MPADVLPPDVIRILSFHGPVSVWVGEEVALARGTAPTAPFEDAVFLFIPVGSPLEAGLLRSCRAQLSARAEDGRYSLRMEGRAQAGQTLARCPRRPELQAWAPDNVAPGRILAVPFVPEHVELVRTDGEVQQRHAGPTPAAKERPSTQVVWLRAALGGLAAPAAGLVLVGLWIWLALKGPEYPARPVAMVLSALAGLLPLAGTRLHVLAAAHARWRRGEVEAVEAPLLTEALLAPEQAKTAGRWALFLGFFLLVVVAAAWEVTLAGLAFGLSGVWVLAPAWAAHLAAAGKRD